MQKTQKIFLCVSKFLAIYSLAYTILPIILESLGKNRVKFGKKIGNKDAKSLQKTCNLSFETL